MSGPGSRLEKVGTIFTRVSGLLRSGALKEHNKPVWYDVYAAFPPKCQQYAKKKSTVQGTRRLDPAEIRKLSLPYQPPVGNILYLEDLIRAKFFKTYGNLEPIDMFDQKTPSVSQRFVEKYFALDAQGVEQDGIFDAAADALKHEGITLKTFEEIEKERADSAAKMAEEQVNVTMATQQQPSSQQNIEPRSEQKQASLSAEQARAEAPDHYDEEYFHPEERTDIFDDDFFEDGK